MEGLKLKNDRPNKRISNPLDEEPEPESINETARSMNSHNLQKCGFSSNDGTKRNSARNLKDEQEQ